ncbi:DUF3413 domain-containing protein [Rheinheimera sp.]|uniref:DUF3413 domain-containing protein n=1 Tax=Rheinheimera sp. TaxID=1869214 RepID=UPI00307EEB61
MVLEQNLSLVSKVNRLLNWGHWFTFFNTLLALGVTSAFWLAEPLPVTAAGWLYLVSNWLGHTAFLCFLFFILSIFPISLVFPYQRHVRGIAAVLATAGLVLLIFDAYVYQSLGYHVGSASSEQTIELLRQQVVTNARNFVLITAAVAALLLAIELTLSNFCWKKVQRLQHSGFGRPLLALFLGSFVFSHSLHIWADAQLKFDVTKQDNVLPLTYPATANTFLARYDLLDLQQLKQDKADQLQTQSSWQSLQPLSCQLSAPAAFRIYVVPTLSKELQLALQHQGFASSDQHFAPVDPQLALLNLVYGQLELADNLSLLQHPPAWLAQQQSIRVGKTGHWPAELSWLTASSTAEQPQLLFVEQPEQLQQLLHSDEAALVLALTASHQQLLLAPAPLLVRWPGWPDKKQQAVTQHLDLLPSLLFSVGCRSNWPGDALQEPSTLPKLNLTKHQLISFKKDKMTVVRDDGSYGVWSAGTLVPLNEKMDLPMLTDALKRIKAP